jgi:uncharacterized protein (DUF433 family)
MSSVLNQHIAMMPSDLHGQKPVIAGTRIRVMDIYYWHVVQGKSPQQIIEEIPHITLADVYAAMTYYWDNEAFMQEQIRREEEAATEALKRYPPKLPEAIRRRNAGGDSVSP